MIVKVFAEPSLEPVTKAELETALGISSGTVASDMTPYTAIPAGSHGVYELMTLDVAPKKTEWAVGNTITGAGGATCVIVEILTTKTYIVSGRTVAYTLGENLSNGTVANDADQGAAYPTFNAYIPFGAVASKGTLTLAGIPADNDTITIGTKTYTWKTALTPTEGQVLIGGSAAIALDNLKAAINLAGTANTDYKCAAAHPTVTATTNTNTTQVVVALTTGVAGDLIATTDVSANATWGAATLAGGVNGYVDVLGHTAVVYLTPVNNGLNGTVDVKIQECDTPTGTYTDWATGGFTTVTESTGSTTTGIQEKAYTGSKQYIRTVAKTLAAACEFGTSIMVWEPNVSDDDMLDDLIETARRDVENDTSRKLITQTWDYFPKDWPKGDRIKIPFGNLQSVSFVKWRDTDGVETNLTKTITAFALSSVTSLTKTQVTSAAHGFADGDIINIDGTTSYDGSWVASNVTTNTFDILIVFVADDATGTATESYSVETNGTQCGFVVLPYGGTWPTGTLHPSNPITIRFICGYGATASSVPITARQAIKARCVNLYANRGDDVIGVNTVNYDKTYDRLVNSVGRLCDMDFL